MHEKTYKLYTKTSLINPVTEPVIFLLQGGNAKTPPCYSSVIPTVYRTTARPSGEPECRPDCLIKIRVINPLLCKSSLNVMFHSFLFFG